MMSRDDNDIKLLSVNVRGMVKHFDRKLLRLDHLINKYQPDFIFFYKKRIFQTIILQRN